MSQGLPPLPPISGVLPRIPGDREAAETQAKTYGGAQNTAAQATVVVDKQREERAKRAAQTLAPRTPGGLLMGLQGVRRDRRSNDDPRRPRVPEALDEGEETGAG